MLAGIIGSPAYVSPEQIRAEAIRPQADIYALGILLFQLLTGQQPFKGPTPIDYVQQHLNQPTPPLLDYNPNLPPKLGPVLERATAKTPAERYADIPNLVRDFRSAVASTGVDLPPSAALEWLPAEQVDLEAIENPYKGLRAFEEADSKHFFGRETLVQELLGRMAEENDLSRFLAVVVCPALKTGSSSSSLPEPIPSKNWRPPCSGWPSIPPTVCSASCDLISVACCAPSGASCLLTMASSWCWWSTSSRSCSLWLRTKTRGPYSSIPWSLLCLIPAVACGL
jgi:serine/threonine protein kinase